MQWDTLVTSIGGAGVVLGVVSYVLKQSFERVLDAKLKESEERHKALVTETIRRQTALYDEQFGTLKTILTLIYRAWNAALEIYPSEANPEGERNSAALRRLEVYHSAVKEMLFEHRAILPGDVFKIAHEGKSLIGALLLDVDTFYHYVGLGRDPRPVRDEIRVAIEILEAHYQGLVSAVQAHLEVEQGM